MIDTKRTMICGSARSETKTNIRKTTQALRESARERERDFTNFLGNSFHRVLVPRYVPKNNRQGKLDPASGEKDQPR